jgi:hypothetical protein
MSIVRSGAYSQNPEPAQRGHSVYSCMQSVYIEHSVEISTSVDTVYIEYIEITVESSVYAV